MNLVDITERLAALVYELRPSLIYTHPYEGGHPDHDSAAFAVASAVADCKSANRMQFCPKVFEFTSYHEGPSGLVTGEFLDSQPVDIVVPSDNERELKERMKACFRSQQKVLADFPVIPEKFRPAPTYDFSQPPHGGALHYEKLGWNITGVQWREKAIQARDLLVTRSVL
jgi:LmbE family N-acetylglucosaminyl deacetylase